jgi:DNA invertase Pin-like site-specific DNA recombinase
MTIGIYTRSSLAPTTFNEINPHILNGLKWMYLNNFDSCRFYTEVVESEFTDMTERMELNRLLNDANDEIIDAVFVSDIKIFSPISIKALQAIISLQEVGMNVYHTNGYFDANDENVKIFKKQFEDNWQRIHEITKNMNLGE